MTVSKSLNENLINLKDLLKFEKHLVIDLIDVNGVEGVFISKNFIDFDIIKFIKNYFGDVRGFENVSITQSMSPPKKLHLEKSLDIADVNIFLNSNMAVLVIDDVPYLYGICVDNSDDIMINDSNSFE